MSALLEEAIEEVRALPPEEQQQLRELTTSFGELLLMALVFAFIGKLDKSNHSEVRSLLERVNSEMHIGVSGGSLRARVNRAELRRLANEQGVKPFDYDDARREFWPEEESADDFLVWLRSVRDEGGHPRSLPE